MRKKGIQLAFGLAAFGLLAACGGEKPARNPGQAVRVHSQVASEVPLPSAEAFVGNIQSTQTITISTKMMGRIKRIRVHEGDAVRRGQPLLDVDAAEARSAHEQAKAGLEAAEVAVRNAERDHERFKALYEEKAVTKHQLEQVEAGLAMAKARKAQAAANLAMASTLLTYGDIRAPEKGIITRKWMDEGNLAYPGAPILTLENPESLELSVAVPEGKARLLARGQGARISVDSLHGDLKVTITTVVAAADPMSRTSTVKLSLPGDAGLRPGQFARVRFDALSSRTLAVPLSAIVRQGQMDGLFVVEAGTARLRWIQTGLNTGEMVQILSGLRPGERIVAPAPKELTDGTPVEVVP